MPTSLVVDASFTFRLFLPGPAREEVRLRIDGWRRDGSELWAPTLWAYEMTSALSKAVRFGQLTPQQGERMLQLTQTLGLQLVPPDDALMRRAFDWTMRLKRSAAYDSFYLALAERLRCELWTADLRLQNAVGQPWVRSIGA
jgi:predicted nucleic acid-binding protein